eukprot:TRINITY_DN11409_c0_g3_i1.p1 TRINITY_DN11409_c0_g3~~TRINITY_DN11409_c0_g3_i1.p1  ORF type:complete len:324 (+),score=30.29 TRINITY_DN11409_c0_g3_i1:48-1019(+)
MPRFRLRSRSQLLHQCCGGANMPKRSLCARLVFETSWPALLVGFIYLIIGTKSLPVQGRNWVVTKDNIGVYSYPYADQEHVPTIGFIIFGFMLAPYLALFEIFYVIGNKLQDRIVFAVNVAFTLIEGFLWTAATTEILKAWVAEPRPDFRHRCFGNLTAPIQYDEDGRVHCTDDIDDGDQSWPSGHSSCSLYFGTFATLFTIWIVYVRRMETRFRTAHGQWKSQMGAMLTEVFFGLCFWPLMLGGWIATSRIVDHRHSPADVITGSVMGMCFAGLFFVRLLSRVPERQPGFDAQAEGQGRLSISANYRPLSSSSYDDELDGEL